MTTRAVSAMASSAAVPIDPGLARDVARHVAESLTYDG